MFLDAIKGYVVLCYAMETSVWWSSSCRLYIDLNRGVHVATAVLVPYLQPVQGTGTRDLQGLTEKMSL